MKYQNVCLTLSEWNSNWGKCFLPKWITTTTVRENNFHHVDFMRKVVWFGSLIEVGNLTDEGHFIRYPLVKTKTKIWIYWF